MSSTANSPALTIASPATLPAPRALPSTGQVFMSLFKADLTTQWRNRRASMMVILLPVIIAISWKGMIGWKTGPFILANAITLGLNAIGLMGYPNSIARDREKEIFQRLRVTPAASWTIMGSRLAVQLFMIILMTAIVMIIGIQYDHVVVSATGIIVGLLMAIVGGAVYLALGQAIVGRIKNPETVNATSRLIYIVFIMVGMFSELGQLGEFMFKAIKYTPYGAVKTIVDDALASAKWTTDTSLALVITLGYTAVFAFLGIKWFKWSNR
jgi:ABC-2 type transport system permease protein